MGNEIQVTSLASGKITRVFKFTKQDSSGQTLEMTATIFDRNKNDNQAANTDGSSSGMIIDSNDAIQFGGKDVAQFKASEIAPFSNVLFKDYDDKAYAPGKENDIEAPVSYNAKGISDINLNTAKPMKLGQFKDGLDQLAYAQGINQTPANGQTPGGGNSVPTPQEFFRMSIPDIKALSNIMEESGYRGCMLMPDLSATPYTMCADIDKALDSVFKPFMLNMQSFMERSSGGYLPNSTPSGQASGSGSSPSPAETAAEKKAKADAEAAKKAEEENEKAKKEATEAAKKKREEEVADILKNLFDSMKMWGTDEEALKTAIGRINKDNVLEVLETWEKSEYAEKMGSKSLIEVIDGETNGIFWSDADEYLKPIAAKLKERSDSEPANLLAGAITSEFETKDVTKLYELVRAEQKADKIKDPIDVRIEKQFEDKKAAEDKIKEKKQKAVEDAKKAEKDAKTDLDKANKLNALKKEAIDLGIVPADDDTIETLTAKIKEAKSKKNKKTLTKAEKEQLKKDLETARQNQLAEAQRNEKLAEKAKKAAENVNKAVDEAKKPVSVKLAAPKTETEVKAANKKSQADLEASKVKKDPEEKKEESEDLGFFGSIKAFFVGKPAPKFTRDHEAPPVVVTPAPAAAPAATPSSAAAPAAAEAPAPSAATPASAVTVTAAKPVAKPALTPAEKKEIDELSKKYISLSTQAIKLELQNKPDDVRKLKQETIKIEDRLGVLGLKQEEIGALYEKADKASK